MRPLAHEQAQKTGVLRPPATRWHQGHAELQRSQQPEGAAEEHRGRDEGLGDLGEGQGRAEHGNALFVYLCNEHLPE